MKRTIVILFLVLATFTLSKAQECTTVWPYVYPEFVDGTLYVPGGNQFNHKFNIHVQESKLHYIDNGIIKEAQSKDILLVKLGEDMYMSFNGQIMKVVGSEERGFVATLILGDFDKLLNSSGAYGTSSNSSATMKLSSVEIGGITVTNHMELRQNKQNGQPLSLKYKYFIVTNGKVYPASKKGIYAELSTIEAAEFKKFLKANKIKWKDTNSLLTLLDFFNQ